MELVIDMAAVRPWSVVRVRGSLAAAGRTEGRGGGAKGGHRMCGRDGRGIGGREGCRRGSKGMSGRWRVYCWRN